MKKLSNKRIQGFASILPLLIIVFLIVSGFAVYNQGRGLLSLQKMFLVNQTIKAKVRELLREQKMKMKKMKPRSLRKRWSLLKHLNLRNLKRKKK